MPSPTNTEENRFAAAPPPRSPYRRAAARPGIHPDQAPRPQPGYGGLIAGQHHGLFHALGLEGPNGLGGIGLGGIGDDQIAEIIIIGRHVDNGADLGDLPAGNADLLHQALIAGVDMPAVNDGFDAAAGVVLGVLDLFFDGLAVGGHHRLGNGMMRSSRQRRRSPAGRPRFRRRGRYG